MNSGVSRRDGPGGITEIDFKVALSMCVGGANCVEIRMKINDSGISRREGPSEIAEMSRYDRSPRKRCAIARRHG